MLDNPTMDLLKFSPFPALAEALRARKDEIMRRWMELVLEKLPTADDLTRDQLRNNLPNVIEKMAVALEAEGGSAMHELREVSEFHGETRFHQSYNINELLVEYGILRPVLLDEVMSHLGRDATREEIAVLNMGVDAAVRRGVTQFCTYQERQLKVVTDAQSKYLSFLSHDLRGGLNGVLLMAEVLKRELAGEPRFAESVQDLDAMRRSILDTVATMDRFLHAERFRQGKVQVRNTTVSLRALLNDLSHHFAHTARDKGLELRIEGADDITAFTDKDLLALILQNLISNAIKYTPAGVVRVVVQPAGDNHGPVIDVIDEGPGVSATAMADLFQPFKRGETHGQPGVGLGLSIAKQAADLLQGRLGCESTPGAAGATFRLALRAA
jgi:signal transduction histidine kinase